MTITRREIAPNRYRESQGRYFEEFVVGDVYEHRPGRTLTQDDNTWFTLLTMNQLLSSWLARRPGPQLPLSATERRTRHRRDRL